VDCIRKRDGSGEPEDGKTDAIGEAKREGQTEVVKLLRKFKKDETKTRDEVRMALRVTLFEAISNGEVSEVREILLKNPTQNVNFQNEAGLTALHCACLDGDDSVACILLSHPGVGVNQKDNDGNTPFMVACLSGKTSCARLLLRDSRVNVNEGDKVGYTPLSRSAAKAALK